MLEIYNYIYMCSSWSLVLKRTAFVHSVRKVSCKMSLLGENVISVALSLSLSVFKFCPVIKT